MCVPYARVESDSGIEYEVLLVTKWNGMSQVLSHIDILDDLSRSQGIDVMSDLNWFVCMHVGRVNGSSSIWTILNVVEVEYETSE